MVTVDSNIVRKCLGRLQVGRRTSFGYEGYYEAERLRSQIRNVSGTLGIKVSTHKNTAKSTIEVTRTA